MNPLFQKRKNPAAKEAGPATTIIGEGIVLKGNLTKGDGTIRIDGTLEGDILVSGHLIIGESGKVHGRVSADALISAGEIIGNIEAKSEAQLTQGSATTGDITTASIIVDQGAVLNGAVRTTTAHKAAAMPAPELKMLDNAKDGLPRRITARPADALTKIDQAQ